MPDRDSPPSSVADLAALGQLWEEHRGRLLAVLERAFDRRLRQRIDPEEVLQDTFLTASRRWPTYQAGSPVHPYAWLYQMALDRLMDAYRRHAGPGRDLTRDQQWPDDCSAVLGIGLAHSGTGPPRPPSGPSKPTGCGRCSPCSRTPTGRS